MRVNQFYDKLEKYYKHYNWPLQLINVFAIRNMEGLKKDIYNDIIGFFCQVTKEVRIYRGTTDPGKGYIEKGGMPGTGAPFLVYGFHPKIWVFDKHNGKYEALCSRKDQGCEPTRVIRDRDRDFDIIDDEIISGYFGIDLHRAGLTPSDMIGLYSAGCQVIQKPADYWEFLREVKKFLPREPVNYAIFTMGEMGDMYNNFYGGGK